MNENLETIFLEKIKKVYDQCVGNESYGGATEFYDEDGVVLMVIEDINQDTVRFTFTDEDTDNVFDYKINTNNLNDKDNEYIGNIINFNNSENSEESESNS